MGEFAGNLLVAQSGGPTSVINASIAGIVLEAGRHDGIEEIYGGLNGILGILREELIDLNEEKARAIQGLKHTPAAALGTCRFKIVLEDENGQNTEDCERLFAVLAAHNIRYFFYIGGNDSQDTAHKVHLAAVKRGYELRVVGVPKTIDNDLPHTDQCPGYGSVIKYNAATVMEISADVGSMSTDDGACCLIEVMGRAAGWIAAGTILAKRSPDEGPHLILVPEIPFDEPLFLTKVKDTITQLGYCIIVVAEGIKGKDGKVLSGEDQGDGSDGFGHKFLSGAAEYLAKTIKDKLALKTRTVKLGYAQRGAAHFASETDMTQAVACGEAAVRAASAGKSGVMVTLVREGESPYRWSTGLRDLKDVANIEELMPRDWLTSDGFLPNEKFIEYASPLVVGEVKIPMEHGLPKYTVLEKIRLEKKLPPYLSHH